MAKLQEIKAKTGIRYNINFPIVIKRMMKWKKGDDIGFIPNVKKGEVILKKVKKKVMYE